jgi:hypothetical protein
MTSDQDVIIIGAPRSGTNMLRDVLAGLPGFATWPCDEINLLWRHGNRDHPSDALGPELATPWVQSYMRQRFDAIRARSAARHVIEKTCANSLRVRFVARCHPAARFVFITRHGLDAAASAMARWNAPLDLRYTAAKARFVPLGDVPYYGARYITGIARKGLRAIPSEGRASDGNGRAMTTWWGPRTEDWVELMRSRPLDEVCLIQWMRCVEAAQQDLEDFGADRVHHLSYEEFVAEPKTELRRVLRFLGREEAFDAAAVRSVSGGSVGKGRASMSAETLGRLATLGENTLKALGYAV